MTCGELTTDLISINSLKLNTPWETDTINFGQMTTRKQSHGSRDITREKQRSFEVIFSALNDQ